MQVLKILSDSAVPFSEDPHDDDDDGDDGDDGNCVEDDHDHDHDHDNCDEAHEHQR